MAGKGYWRRGFRAEVYGDQNRSPISFTVPHACCVTGHGNGCRYLILRPPIGCPDIHGEQASHKPADLSYKTPYLAHLGIGPQWSLRLAYHSHWHVCNEMHIGGWQIFRRPIISVFLDCLQKWLGTCLKSIIFLPINFALSWNIHSC